MINATWHSYIKSAKKRGISFSLSKELFADLLFKSCYYCGREPSNSMQDRATKKRNLPRYNGIDRVDNSNGYFEGNVVTACRWCNEAKRAKTLEEFNEWVEGLSKNYYLRNRA